MKLEDHWGLHTNIIYPGNIHRDNNNNNTYCKPSVVIRGEFGAVAESQRFQFTYFVHSFQTQAKLQEQVLQQLNEQLQVNVMQQTQLMQQQAAGKQKLDIKQVSWCQIHVLLFSFCTSIMFTGS